MNDIPMIQAAHVGAAMINGDDCVKEVADYITTTDNNHGGVAEVIRKFILSYENNSCLILFLHLRKGMLQWLFDNLPGSSLIWTA